MGCQRRLGFLCSIYVTVFKIGHNNNSLYYYNYLYKRNDSEYNISYINIDSITKEHSLNYFTISESQILLIDQVLINKPGRENSRINLFSNST